MPAIVTTEAEEMLKLARGLRDEVIVGKGMIYSQLMKFQTIAQGLHRIQDVSWAEKEIRGYPDSETVPQYRQLTMMFSKKGVNLGHFKVNMRTSITRMEDLLRDKSITKNTLSFSCSNITIQETKISTSGIPTHEYSMLIHKSNAKGLLYSVKSELLKRLNITITDIIYGNTLQVIFSTFHDQVSEILETNSEAISQLNIAYENLGQSEDSERISHVAFACRRLVKAVSDKLYPPCTKATLKDGSTIDAGEEKFLNRLHAYIDSIDSPDAKYLLKKLEIIKDLLSKVPESVNKGVHDKISRTEAEKMVLYSYIILGDIILATSKNKQ